MTQNNQNMPTLEGYFGPYGGAYIPPQLKTIMEDIAKAYEEIRVDPSFIEELAHLRKHYIGRPSPIFHAKTLSAQVGGADIYLKREDLNHTGAHKINHCTAEALLARKMGKKKIIAETGAGQHGVALATAAALIGLECDIYMGEVDVEKEHPNVSRMKVLGARVISVDRGGKTLKDAVDAAFEAYLADPDTQMYAIGSAVGPHPFPMMIRDFQSVVGYEAREQMTELTGRLPDALTACVGGGSNAIGLFTAFLEDEDVAMYGVEPAGKSFKVGEHAATLTLGRPGVLHGYNSYLLQDTEGNVQPVYSVASGLDYPGVGPQHSFLKDTNRVTYVTANDEETIDAFYELSRIEGIIPALESAHAVAYTKKLAKEMGKGKNILVNLSGRGDKDIDYVLSRFPKPEVL
ncbi:MAG: tryptophan synthase subunit beta [Spirochaetota bacterium]